MLCDFVGFLQKEDYDCGVAVAMAMLHRWKVLQDYDTIFEQLQPNKKTGTPHVALKRLLENYGLTVLVKQMDGGDLKNFGTGGVPVICLVNFDGEGHYVISRGVASDKVCFYDPYSGEKRMKVSKFETFWHYSRRLGIAAWD